MDGPIISNIDLWEYGLTESLIYGRSELIGNM